MSRGLKLSLDGLTPQEYMRFLVKRRHGSQTAWARHLGVSPSMVSGVLSGTRSPTKEMLDDLGMERVVIYRPKESSHG
jgi:predicted transcriptional regulator